MLKIKSLFFIVSVAILMGCQTQENDTENKETNVPKIIKAELQAYAITDELIVNSVDAILYNPGEAKNFHFVVTMHQGEETWIDTNAYYAISKDTSRFQVVFSKSIFSEENQAKFNAQIVEIKEQPKAE